MLYPSRDQGDPWRGSLHANKFKQIKTSDPSKGTPPCFGDSFVAISPHVHIEESIHYKPASAGTFIALISTNTVRGKPIANPYKGAAMLFAKRAFLAAAIFLFGCETPSVAPGSSGAQVSAVGPDVSVSPGSSGLPDSPGGSESSAGQTKSLDQVPQAAPGMEDPCQSGALAFGPETLERGTGKPVTTLRSFTLPSQSTICISIQNAGASAEWVKIDGVLLIGPDRLNPNVPGFTQQAHLAAGAHEISIRLASKPGSSITVAIRALAVIPCDGVVCNTPPPSQCASNSTLTVYDSPGTCADGVCSYPSHTEPCAFGCSNGACNLTQCSSGPCCVNGLFASTDVQCSPTAHAEQFACSGSGCGADVIRRYQYPFCSGQSAECDLTNLKWQPWEPAQDCESGSICESNGTTASCKTCAFGCQSGQCNPDPCQDVPCQTPPAAECQDTNTLKVYDAQGSCTSGICFYPSHPVACQFGCGNGQCNPDPCASVLCENPPANRCQDDLTLISYSAQGACAQGNCLYTSEAQNCLFGCANGACNLDPCLGIVCENPPSASCLDANTRLEYLPGGTCAQGQCHYSTETSSCPFGCANGSCNPDPCLGVVCGNPPASTCQDANTRLSYNPQGTCAGGFCSYSPAIEICPFGCAGGACSPDPCLGVVCENPPANQCQDGGTLLVYAATGACENGTCTYATQTQTCPFRCASGQCNPDPCAGVTCTTPPASLCQADGSLVVYAPQGSCTGGICSYTSNVEACQFGCQGSACNPDPCIGVACNTPPSSFCQDASTLVNFALQGSCAQGNCTYPTQTQACPFGCANGACNVDPCLGVVCSNPPIPRCEDANTKLEYLTQGSCSQGQCTYPTQTASCPFGCANGQCNPDPCLGVSCQTPPANQCQGESSLLVYASAGNCASGNCLYDSHLEGCQFGCSNGACNPDPCIGVLCSFPPVNYCQDASTLVNYDLEGSCSLGMCTYPYHTQSCTFGCANGACNVDPCQGVVCNSPPNALCIDPSTKQEYLPAGTCVEGQCQYTTQTTSCEFGCANGACNPDPCQGVICEDPPAATCLDANTRQTYASSGSCTNGACVYASQTATCQFGCANGACNPDPCAGVYCENPPVNTCQDDMILVVYSAQGSCAEGSCNYGSTTQQCVFGCANGACKEDPCLGIVCNTPPSPSCLDASTRQEYLASGTCSQGQCMYTSQTTTCQFGCASGQCNPDPCEGVVCTTPPQSVCQDATTVTVYEAAGTCASGLCSYASHPEACTFGCANGSCNPAQCTGGPCCSNGFFSPASTRCSQTPFNEEYACSGSGCGAQVQRRVAYQYCSGASSECGTSNLVWSSWEQVESCAANALCLSDNSVPYCATCAFGCQAGQCIADPCAGVACNAPPQSVCQDEATLVTYLSQGTCSGGSCTYPTQTTVCDHGCLNGACRSEIPPDPATVAPPIDPTKPTTMFDSTAFLYTGPNPIQTGMSPETIEPMRAAVLRGKVKDRAEAPLSGVVITVLGHPEFGQTLSREDGYFDMAVNGGGALTVNYQKEGYLSVQRQIETPWNDYALLPDVVLIPFDPIGTPIDLDSGAMEVARGSLTSDERGDRQATVLFPAGTQAELILEDGSTMPMNQLTIRVTEFTVGPNGPQAMPGELPPTNNYTYAADISADELFATGAKSVQFNQPVYYYLENFLNLPAGIAIPVGYYSEEKAQWITSKDGVVIKILAISNGFAEIDTDGDGIADNGVALGMTEAERAKIATLYQAGQSLWRVPLTHFTTVDFNLGRELEGNTSPNSPPYGGSPPSKCFANGSIVECQSQVLRETIPIVGTPYSLNYRSDLVAGYRRPLKIPLIGSTIPPYLQYVSLFIRIAGKETSLTFAPEANLAYSFVWDGRDVYGREVNRDQQVMVRVGYGYRVFLKGYYYRTNYDSFGNYAGTERVIVRVLDGYDAISRTWNVMIGDRNVPAKELGGWTIDPHHLYDPYNKALFLGDGSKRFEKVESTSTILKPLNWAYRAGSGPVTNNIDHMTMGPDGSIYGVDANNIVRIAPNGVASVVVCFGSSCNYISYPVVHAQWDPAEVGYLGSYTDFEIGADGSFYLAEACQVLKVAPDGWTTRIAGTGVCRAETFMGTIGPPGGDGGPAINAMLLRVSDISVSPKSGLFIAEMYRIRHVTNDGVISTVAGNSDDHIISCLSVWFDQEGVPAVDAPVCMAQEVLTIQDGSIYFTKSGPGFGQIKKVDTNGVITTVAGINPHLQGGDCSSNPTALNVDGIPATQRCLNPRRMLIATDGTILFTNTSIGTLNPEILKIHRDGTIWRVIGDPASEAYTVPCPADYSIASNANFRGYSLDGILLDAHGDLNIDSSCGIKKLVTPFPDFPFADFIIASSSGSEIYLFNSFGRHTRTYNAIKGTTQDQFLYTPDGNLASIFDSNGNQTVIERDLDGKPTAIVGPYGQRTTLTLDPNGYLKSITNPAGEIHQFVYTADGLLRFYTDPRSLLHTFIYDQFGSLILDKNPAEGHVQLSAIETQTKRTVIQTSALGVTKSYQTEDLIDGSTKMTVTFPDGTQNISLERKNGQTQLAMSDGTVILSQKREDPRFGMQAPIAAAQTTSMPSGLTQSISSSAAAPLSDPANLFSFTKLEDTTTINGNIFRNTYDPVQSSWTSTSPMQRKSYTWLDTQGRVIKAQVDGLAPSEITYDQHGRPSTLTTGSGADLRLSQLTYNTEGLLDSITDALNRTTSLTYDLANRVISKTLPDDRVIYFSYDANGNVTSITPPGRPVHEFSYTLNDLQQSYNPPAVTGLSANLTYYTYNLDNQLDLVTRPDGQQIDIQYNTAGKLSAIQIPGDQIIMAYSPTTGQLASIFGLGGSTLSYTWDGQLQTQTTWNGPVAGTLGRTYDNDFRLQALTINGTYTIPFVYDNDSLLTQAGSLQLTRDPLNGLLLGTQLDQVITSQDYNQFGEITFFQADVAGAPVYQVQYVRDSISRITQKSETVQGTTTVFGYTYDTARRLKEVWKDGALASTYDYDQNSNRVAYTAAGQAPITAVYDSQDRLLQHGNKMFTYTPNGELQTKIEGNQTTTYSYDVFGNLRNVKLPDGTEIEYVIDGRGRRIGKKVNGALVQGFLYQDQLKPVAELDGNGNVVSYFIYGGRRNSPEYMMSKKADGTNWLSYRIITDHLGSPRLIVDTVTGVIAQRMDFDEFGIVTLDSQAGLQPFGFAGGLYDNDTKLVKFGARDYCSETGRWLQKDPIEFEVGLNLFEYALSDPINTQDFNGLSPDLCSFPAPDILLLIADFREPCRKHDDCYGGHLMPRLDCDLKFYEDMINSCSAHPLHPLNLPLCVLAAEIYFGAVRGFGGGYYNPPPPPPPPPSPECQYSPCIFPDKPKCK